MEKINRKIKVLLISCGLPFSSSPFVGITSIATYLMSKGVDVRIFDDNPYMLDIVNESTDPREMLGLVKKTDPRHLYRLPFSNRFDDLFKLLSEFMPDIVGVSSTEPTFSNAIKYLNAIKERVPHVKTMLGGPFAILAHDIAISYQCIDMVALGEGEIILEEYCQRLQAGKNPDRTEGLLLKKKNGNIQYNPVKKLMDLKLMPPLRFDLYPEKRLNRAISGAIRRMLPLEVSRGCPFNCTFCASPEFRLRLKSGGDWYRYLNLEQIDNNISTYIKLYHPDYFFVISESFLKMSPEFFDGFVEMYKRYRIPFWMNTRPETISEHNIKRLKDIGLERISIGVECGNEDYRSKMLNRKYTNSHLVNAFNICKEYDIRATANIMIGLPDETRKMIFESIRLVKELEPTSIGLSIYQPYKGTYLHDYAVKNKYYVASKIIDTTAYSSQMQQPQISSGEIDNLLYKFNLYTKMSEKEWPAIDSLDVFTDDGIAKLREMLKACDQSVINR